MVPVVRPRSFSNARYTYVRVGLLIDKGELQYIYFGLWCFFSCLVPDIRVAGLARMKSLLAFVFLMWVLRVRPVRDWAREVKAISDVHATVRPSRFSGAGGVSLDFCNGVWASLLL